MTQQEVTGGGGGHTNTEGQGKTKTLVRVGGGMTYKTKWGVTNSNWTIQKLPPKHPNKICKVNGLRDRPGKIKPKHLTRTEDKMKQNNNYKMIIKTATRWRQHSH